MLKKIVEIFTEPKDIEKSSVGFKVEVPEKTKEVWFNEAVREVTRDKIKDVLCKEMILACYSDEAIKQTKAAIEESEKYGTCFEVLNRKYPKALSNRSYSFSSFIDIERLDRRDSSRFDLSRFLDRLLEKEGL